MARTSHRSSRSASFGKITGKSRWRWPLLIALLLVVLAIPSTAAGISIHMENNDAFCASCHTEPETTFVKRVDLARINAADPQDLATAHAIAGQTVHCIDCHSGPGIMGRMDALTLGARDLIAYARGNYPQPAPLTHPIPDSYCTKCHADYALDRSFDNHYHVFLARWQRFAGEKAAGCVDCHTGHVQDGDPRLAFLNEPRVVAQCNACHRVMGD